MLSRDELIAFSEIDKELISRKSLKELPNISLYSNMELEERLETFLEEVRNPYYFLVNGVPVKISYNNHSNKTLDECLYSCLLDKRNLDN